MVYRLTRPGRERLARQHLGKNPMQMTEWSKERVDDLFRRTRRAQLRAEELSALWPAEMGRSDGPGPGGSSHPSDPLELSLSEVYPALAGVVPDARAALTRFAEEAGLDAGRVEGLRLAVSEAVTNVVRHAYPDSSGALCVTANVAADELWVLVADHGCGYQTPSHHPGLGFGLGIIARESDDLVITERAEGGTELRMRFLLHAEAPHGGRLH